MFEPAVISTAQAGRLFLISGQALCVLRGPAGVSVPTGAAGPAFIHLGLLDGVPCFGRALAEGEAQPEGVQLVPLRQLFGALPDVDFAIAGRALGLIAWDGDHRFCGRCGALTERSKAERTRVCGKCGYAAYPRVSPAIITLVERDGRALLARNARVNLPFFSTLAGFVELGENLEETVVREVREEAGIEIGDVRYFGSQPWPLGGSLMIGFTARWASGEIVCDPTEIVDAAWFGPDELPPIPPRLSIARELIDDFVRRAR